MAKAGDETDAEVRALSPREQERARAEKERERKRQARVREHERLAELDAEQDRARADEQKAAELAEAQQTEAELQPLASFTLRIERSHKGNEDLWRVVAIELRADGSTLLTASTWRPRHRFHADLALYQGRLRDFAFAGLGRIPVHGRA